MSLDKSIIHGKEKRKMYRGSKAIDCTCRNHGSCDWCLQNRKHKFRDKNFDAIDDYYSELSCLNNEDNKQES